VTKDPNLRNQMMRRPVLEENTLQFIRTEQKPFTGKLGALQKYAVQNNVPIIPHETAVFLKFIVKLLRPKEILEVGTAVGFSALLMAQNTPETSHITTIDRFPIMISQAKQNFEDFGETKKITLLEGQASELLPKLPPKKFDLIFLDCSKQHYQEFFEICLNLLSDNGVILVDDLFQGGTVFIDETEFSSKNRKIRQGLRSFLDYILAQTSIESTIIPIGDGLLMAKKQI
jgi:predicted O-methyltransferase YrrM